MTRWPFEGCLQRFRGFWLVSSAFPCKTPFCRGFYCAVKIANNLGKEARTEKSYKNRNRNRNRNGKELLKIEIEIGIEIEIEIGEELLAPVDLLLVLAKF